MDVELALAADAGLGLLAAHTKGSHMRHYCSFAILLLAWPAAGTNSENLAASTPRGLPASGPRSRGWRPRYRPRSLALTSFLSIEDGRSCYFSGPTVGIPVSDLPPTQPFDNNIAVIDAVFEPEGYLLNKPGTARVNA